MRRLTPTQIGLIIAGILILAFAAWTFASTRRSNPDNLSDDNAVAAKPEDQEKRCGSQATYDLIKRELFRRAAVLRGSDQAAFDRLAAYSVVRIDRPLLEKGDDDRTDAIACSGSLTLELPPGVAVVGGRRSLSADIGYALQGSADGNGQVLTLTRADAIVTPLATLARVGSENEFAIPAPTTDEGIAPAPVPVQPPPSARPDQPVQRAPAPPPPVAAPAPRPRPSAPPPRALEPAPLPPPREEPVAPPPRTSSARPSFNCANARTRGEIAVCRDGGLASLDRQMSAQFFGALRNADPATRALLQRSRSRFLTYRDQCPSNACIAQTYRGRMREIRDIANGSYR
ncbi:MAG: hypothetical protein ABIN83_08445 [Sphingomicrobium sp.]